MIWFLVAMVVAVLGCAAVVGSGRWGSMPELVDERAAHALPQGPLTGDDLRGASFSVVSHGYAIAEVDALLSRLAEQLDEVLVGQQVRPADKAGEEPAEDIVAPE